ncbi:hypothetical protein MASR2M78_22050 [Treponema sp.]
MYGLFISKNEASDFCSSISTNTIDGGWWNKTDDGSGFVIVLNDQANPKINNNHFVLIKTGNIEMYGVAEYGTDADPKTLNNNYFDFTGNWYRDEGATTISTANWDIAEISTGEGSGKLFNSIWGNMK